MMRKCDGNDPNLKMRVDGDGPGTLPKYVPCTCGKVFDDVYYLTIWPHGKFRELDGRT